MPVATSVVIQLVIMCRLVHLRAQTGVGAYIKDFPFELKYTVTSFSISADNDEGDIETADCQGNTWNAKAQQILKISKQEEHLQ